MDEIVLNIDSVIKRYDSVSVLKGISATMRRGEIIAVLGKNGAGKTTLMESVLGFAPIESGDIAVFGQSPLTLTDDVKKRIGYVPQQDDLLPNLSVISWLQLIRAFYPTWDTALQDRLLSEWDIPGDKRIAKLSVGQRQKISIITGICHRPDLLVLDEPVASLDPIARRQFLETLIMLTQSQAPAILFSTHIVSDVERIASRVWLMRNGEIVVDSALDDLKERVVRVHGSAEALAPLRQTRQVIGERRHQALQTLIVADWSTEHAPSASITVEQMGLEDIFVELNP